MLASSSKDAEGKIILERKAPCSTSWTLIAEAFALLMGLNHVERLNLHQLGVRSDSLQLNNLLISNSLTVGENDATFSLTFFFSFTCKLNVIHCW